MVTSRDSHSGWIKFSRAGHLIVVTTCRHLPVIGEQEEGNPRDLAPIRIEQVREAADLVVLRVPYQEIVDARLDGYSGGVRCLLLAGGEAMIATDLDHATLEHDEAAGRITLTLPPPRALSAQLDPDKTRVLDIARSGAWHLAIGGAGEDRVMKKAMEKAGRKLREAAGNPNHITAARHRAETVLTRVIEREGWKLTVRWTDRE